jgi:hypothetical protein
VQPADSHRSHSIVLTPDSMHISAHSSFSSTRPFLAHCKNGTILSLTFRLCSSVFARITKTWDSSGSNCVPVSDTSDRSYSVPSRKFRDNKSNQATNFCELYTIVSRHFCELYTTVSRLCQCRSTFSCRWCWYCYETFWNAVTREVWLIVIIELNFIIQFTVDYWALTHEN